MGIPRSTTLLILKQEEEKNGQKNRMNKELENYQRINEQYPYLSYKWYEEMEFLVEQNWNMWLEEKRQIREANRIKAQLICFYE